MRHDFSTLLNDLDFPPPLTERQAGLCVLLRLRLEALAEDVWVLAQKSPALVADPALVALAGPMLADLRVLLRREPGVHLLPGRLPAGITLHALALALRRMQRELATFLARRSSSGESSPAANPLATANQILAETALKAAQRVARRFEYNEDEDEDEEDAPEEPKPESEPAARPLSRNVRRIHRRAESRPERPQPPPLPHRLAGPRIRPL